MNLHPLPPGDPLGLVEFYATLAASIVGFVVMFELRANVPGLSLGGWLALILVFAVVGGLALAIVVGPLINALPGPFPELWYALSTAMAVAALVCSARIVLVDRWAIVRAWLLFVGPNVRRGHRPGATLRPLRRHIAPDRAHGVASEYGRKPQFDGGKRAVGAYTNKPTTGPDETALAGCGTGGLGSRSLASRGKTGAVSSISAWRPSETTSRR